MTMKFHKSYGQNDEFLKKVNFFSIFPSLASQLGENEYQNHRRE